MQSIIEELCNGLPWKKYEKAMDHSEIAFVYLKSGELIIDGDPPIYGPAIAATYGVRFGLSQNADLLVAFKNEVSSETLSLIGKLSLTDSGIGTCLNSYIRKAGATGKRMIVFSAKGYDKHFFEPWLSSYQQELGIKVEFQEVRLTEKTIKIAQGAEVLCLFVNDEVTEDTAAKLRAMGVRLICLRCAGTNNIAIEACKKAGIQIANVPDYGPNSVAEHALALILALNRKLHLVHDQIRYGNFLLTQGLLGFEMHGAMVGIVGTGRIGSALAKILVAMGCRVFCHDKVRNESLLGCCSYVSLEELLSRSMVVSLHVPLTKETHHLIDDDALSIMPKGSLLINTSRGGLVDTKALIRALKSKSIGGAGLDVYEAEAGQFYSDLSGTGISDDTLARLLTFPNVIVTCHQGFFTHEAMQTIARTTFENVKSLLQ